MNKSFKVVFNKARGALMVVNEVTSSVQAKGTKTVIAAAVASLIAGVAGTAVAGSVAIGDTEFDSLKAALDESNAKDTIVLKQDLQNQTGLGFGENNPKFTTAKNVTIDLNNFSYIVAKDPSAGSAGTESQGLHIENTAGAIKFKNGTLVFDSTNASNLKMGIQNYTDLTLENVVVDGSKLGKDTYTMSNNCGDVVIKDSTITAHKDGVAFDVYYWPKNGYTDGVSVTVENSTIQGHIEVKSDGTSNIEKKHNLTIDGGVLAAVDRGEKLGGNIYTEGYATVKNVTFSGSKAGSGAGIYNKGVEGQLAGDLTLENVKFEGNSVAMMGGAIYNDGGKVQAENVAYTGNTSVSNGGALAVVNDGKYVQTGGSFVQNQATTSEKVKTANGGAIYVNGNGSTLDLTNVTISGNTASNGGAVYADGQAKLSFTDTVFTDNKAAGWGGAVRLNGAEATFAVTEGKHLVYAGNKANIDAKDAVTTKYGAHGGDFMYIQGGSTANFDVAENASLTIKDKIAGQSTEASVATLTKKGAGLLTVADLGDFVGNLNVQAGKMVVEGGIAEFDLSAQMNANGSKLPLHTTAVEVGTMNGVAELQMGKVVANHGLTFKTNGESTLTLDSLTVGSTEYTKLPAEAKADAQKVTSNGVVAFNGDATIKGALTVAVKKEAAVTKQDVADVTVTDGTLTVTDVNVAKGNQVAINGGEFEVLGKIDSVESGVTVADNATITTDSANLVMKNTAGSLVNNKMVTLSKSANVGLTDAGSFTVEAYKAMQEALAINDGGLKYLEAELVAKDGGKETLDNLLTVGGYANKSAVKVVYSDKAGIADGSSKAVTVGSIEFVKDKADTPALESVTVKGAEDKLFTLRGDKNGDVILGAGDLVVNAQHVRFGEEADDKGDINNELKATNVSVKGQFNANKGVTLGGDLNIEKDGAFTTAWAEGGKFVMNGGALGILGTKPVKAEAKAAADAEPVPFSGAVVFNTKVENKQVGSNLTFNNTTGNVVGLGADALTAKAIVAEHYGDKASEKNVYYVAKQVKTDGISTSDMLVDVAGVAATEGFAAKDGVLSGDLKGKTQVKLLNLTAAALEGKAGEKTLKLAKSAVEGTTVDYGTVFYSAPSATNANIWTAAPTGVVATDGKVAFKANEQLVENVLDHGVMTGAVVNALNNVTFGQNQLVDAVVFGTDAYFDAAEKQWTKIEEAMKKANPEVKPEEVQLAKDAFYAQTEDAFVEGVDAVSYLGVLGGAFSTAVDINNETAKVLNRRMSVANGVERAAQGVNVWADVVATRNEGKGLFGDNVGYEADIYGAAFGADFTASCGAILGAALTVGQADANSAGLDYTKVENDVEYFGFSIYGAHQMGLVNGMFDIGYTSLKNELSTNTVLGKFKEDVDGTMFTVGLGAEYLAKAGSVNVVPHAGLRWTRVDLDDSKFGADYDTMNLFQMPIGVTFSGNFETAGWKLAPMFDLSVVPTFGDKDATADYGFGYSDAIRVVDSNPVQATLGVSAQTGAWTFGVNYGLTAGSDDRMNNSLNASARYTF